MIVIIKKTNYRGDNMHYDALNTFVTVVELQHFTKAAQQLRISQPSVSLHIKNLEEEFQTTLFIRTPKKVSVTPSGKIVYERAKQMISIYEQMKREIAEYHHEVQGELKIGASFTIGEYILPAIAATLHKEFPKLQLNIVIGNTEEVVAQVRMFQVDIGLIEGQTSDKEIHIEPFMEDELGIVCHPSHPLAKKKNITIEQLQEETWVLREKGSGTREFMEHVIRSNGVKVDSLLTISSNHGVKEAVMNGVGLTFLSNCVVNKEIENGSLVKIDFNQAKFQRKFSYIYSPVMLENKAVQLFLKQLHKWR